MAHTRTAKLFLLWGLTALSIPYMQGQEKRMTTVYLTSDCVDSVGEIASSALREKIRGSNGYSLAVGSTKGKSGFEIILTCAAIPGDESNASAVSYVFDAVLPDGARFFVQPGVGVVGKAGVDGWVVSLFSQFDDWVSSTQKAMSE